jgi:hypothetical protein
VSETSTGYIWTAHTGTTYPHVYRDIEKAKAAAEAEYRKRNAAQYPNATPQPLEWHEKTNPNQGFARNRFWFLYAERRASSKRTGYHDGATFSTNYSVSEVDVEEMEEE